MDNVKIASELVAVAKELTAYGYGDAPDIDSMVSDIHRTIGKTDDDRGNLVMQLRAWASDEDVDNFPKRHDLFVLAEKANKAFEKARMDYNKTMLKIDREVAKS